MLIRQMPNFRIPLQMPPPVQWFLRYMPLFAPPPFWPLLHLPVCPSICPMPMIYSKSERCRNFKFGRDITVDTSNWERIFEVRDQSLGTKMWNLFFMNIFTYQKSTILGQTKTKMRFFCDIRPLHTFCLLSIGTPYKVYIFMRQWFLTLVNGEVILISKVTGNENTKIVFAHTIVKSVSK